MKLDRIKFCNGKPYIEYIRKSGKWKGKAFRNYGQIITCQVCKERAFIENANIKEGNGRFCSHKCQCIEKNNPNWKGYRKETAGYITILQHTHPFANKKGYIMEHRLIIEKQIGRYLHRWEIAHHINKIKDDNKPTNLMAFSSQSAHVRFERGGIVESNEIIFDGKNKIKVK